MFELIGFAAACSAAVLGYVKTRDFVVTRLRYVDAVHDASAPLKAGGLAFLAAVPVVWVLPFIGAPTALVFGAAVGAGVRTGARNIRSRLPGT